MDFEPTERRGVIHRQQVVLGESESIGYRMKTEKEVGIVLHFLIQKGWVPFYRKDERLEIVVRKNIPPAHILKIIPFYQKNSEFKRKKENVEDTMS